MWNINHFVAFITQNLAFVFDRWLAFSLKYNCISSPLYTHLNCRTYQKDSNKWQRTPGGARLSRESPPECVAVRGWSAIPQQRSCSSACCLAAGCSPSPAHHHTGHKYWAGHAGLKHHGSSPAFAICAAAPHTPPCPQETPAPSHSPCAPCTSPPRGSAFSHLRQFAAAAVCNLPCFWNQEEVISWKDTR